MLGSLPFSFYSGESGVLTQFNFKYHLCTYGSCLHLALEFQALIITNCLLSISAYVPNMYLQTFKTKIELLNSPLTYTLIPFLHPNKELLLSSSCSNENTFRVTLDFLLSRTHFQAAKKSPLAIPQKYIQIMLPFPQPGTLIPLTKIILLILKQLLCLQR